MAVLLVVCFLYCRLTGRRGMLRLWAAWTGKICGRTLEVSGAAPDPAAQLVIANHTGHLDLLPLLALWPAVRPLARKQARVWFGDSVVLVDESDPSSRANAREAMRRIWEAGGSVLVFPQGDITRRRGRFRVGAFEEAAAAGVLLQAARITYPPELLAHLSGRPLEAKFFWVLCQNVHIRVHVFPPERAAGDPAALAAAWERRLLGSGIPDSTGRAYSAPGPARDAERRT